MSRLLLQGLQGAGLGGGEQFDGGEGGTDLGAALFELEQQFCLADLEDDGQQALVGRCGELDEVAHLELRFLFLALLLRP